MDELSSRIGVERDSSAPNSVVLRILREGRPQTDVAADGVALHGPAKCGYPMDMDTQRPSPDAHGLAVADLGPRRSSDPAVAVHAVRAFDETGGEWSGLVAFSSAAHGRETPEAFARALTDLAGGDEHPRVARLAALHQPIRLTGDAARPVAPSAAHTIERDERADPESQAVYRELHEPADGRRTPDQAVDGPVAEFLDTYQLPRFVPGPVKVAGCFLAIGIAVLVLWWLVIPHGTGWAIGLGLVELALLAGALGAVFLSPELTRLPGRRPVQPPSTKGLDPP